MTKKKAISKVKGYLTDYLPSDNYEEVEEIIKALEQESKWIPVSERLPKDNETVIASIKHGYVYPEARYSKEYGWEWPWVYLDGKVEAWMPLPKAYREVE